MTPKGPHAYGGILIQGSQPAGWVNSRVDPQVGVSNPRVGDFSDILDAAFGGVK